ncbi:hypothetical protein [Psychromonas aquimarina]|uniref:hypothetical protein n=1 Tax=Psychromonas aquimarina TaxID=444919 RepID=UPI0003FA8744|nr:hypothetical protein [Psychromonas aquimarina]
MRQQYHFRQSEQGLLAWDVFRLLKLSQSLTVKKFPLQAITELDEPFWYGLGGALPTCRNVAQHALLIDQADLTYPIILCCEGRVMDGMHRVCKALKNGLTYIDAVQFTHAVQPDYIGVEPDDLPY